MNNKLITSTQKSHVTEPRNSKYGHEGAFFDACRQNYRLTYEDIARETGISSSRLKNFKYRTRLDDAIIECLMKSFPHQFNELFEVHEKLTFQSWVRKKEPKFCVPVTLETCRNSVEWLAGRFTFLKESEVHRAMQFLYPLDEKLMNYARSFTDASDKHYLFVRWIDNNPKFFVLSLANRMDKVNLRNIEIAQDRKYRDYFQHLVLPYDEMTFEGAVDYSLLRDQIMEGRNFDKNLASIIMHSLHDITPETEVLRVALEHGVIPTQTQLFFLMHGFLQEDFQEGGE